MDRFDAMLAFARVVEIRSFTKAAETLHLSRTSVTQLVQQLEARLRLRLRLRLLNDRPDAALYRLPAEPACQREAAGVHRLGGGVDGAACAGGGAWGRLTDCLGFRQSREPSNSKSRSGIGRLPLHTTSLISAEPRCSAL